LREAISSRFAGTPLRAHFRLRDNEMQRRLGTGGAVRAHTNAHALDGYVACGPDIADDLSEYRAHALPQQSLGASDALDFGEFLIHAKNKYQRAMDAKQ
jgi:hypothetical protein